MLAVEDCVLIRRKVIIEGRSQRDVAKELHHSRKTIAKGLELMDRSTGHLSSQ